MKNKITSIISIVLMTSILFSCASVVRSWNSYPIGTDLEAKKSKIVYVEAVEDFREPNVIILTEEPVPGDIYKVNLYDQTLIIEDRELQKASSFLTSAIKQDLRDAGFELTPIAEQADYILKTRLLTMEASKFRNVGSVILTTVLAVPTLGLSLYFLKDDVTAECSFDAKIIDVKTNTEISNSTYSTVEIQKETVFDGGIINPEYFLVKSIKNSVQKLIADLIKL